MHFQLKNIKIDLKTFSPNFKFTITSFSLFIMFVDGDFNELKLQFNISFQINNYLLRSELNNKLWWNSKFFATTSLCRCILSFFTGFISILSEKKLTRYRHDSRNIFFSFRFYSVTKLIGLSKQFKKYSSAKISNQHVNRKHSVLDNIVIPPASGYLLLRPSSDDAHFYNFDFHPTKSKNEIFYQSST